MAALCFELVNSTTHLAPPSTKTVWLGQSIQGLRDVLAAATNVTVGYFGDGEKSISTVNYAPVS